MAAELERRGQSLLFGVSYLTCSLVFLGYYGLAAMQQTGRPHFRWEICIGLANDTTEDISLNG